MCRVILKRFQLTNYEFILKLCLNCYTYLNIYVCIVCYQKCIHILYNKETFKNIPSLYKYSRIDVQDLTERHVKLN